ncbi:hypothetical protein BDQ12DRAFT_696506 [Crucibulum laeve]|uniref:RRM domain-containing protein n=1 Tax=Crucibulum laeve TaxID=68775 RepID=A0A5C3MB04_9AGAR|nr:hypothetical protein BDQ12DRAFT_696506 [Crucibulum laeve]
MNRHHPYGGSFENIAAPRRGGSPSGPGPDRTHRFQERGGAPFRGRGGFGRGRGGYGSFEGSMSHSGYDQGPPQGDMGPYSDYDQGAAQNPYYQNQNTNYPSGPPAPYAAPPPSGGYESQGFGKFEDGAGQNYDDEYSRGQRRPMRKERDDKVHDSIIEERIQRERPCRTLFIRNIKYETNSDDVRRQFEEHGEIKTFFDLISTRGMVFVTYFDLRAAERARERLQGSEISGRPIDVHYSLPRDDQRGTDREKNQQLQGALQVTLRNSPSGQPIDDNEVKRKFQQFGDVKSVKPVGDRPDSRYVEFYDTRACDDAFDRLRHQGLQDGVMDIVFAWDVNEGNANEENARSGRGGRGRARGRGRGRGQHDEFDDRRGGGGGGGGDYGGRDRGRGGRYEDDFGVRGGRGGGGGGGGGYNDRQDAGRGYGGSAPGGYGNGMSPQGPYGGPPPPPPAAAGAPDDRLEQARKVQQLLAALKQPQAAPPATAAPAPMPAPPMSGMPPMQPMQQLPNPYYPPPPSGMPPYPGAITPNGAYGGIPTTSSTPQPPNPALSGLPPNILALLQSAQQQRPPGAPPAPGQYGMPPPGVMNTPPPPPPSGAPAATGAQYQQLMSYLQTQAAAKR